MRATLPWPFKISIWPSYYLHLYIWRWSQLHWLRWSCSHTGQRHTLRVNFFQCLGVHREGHRNPVKSRDFWIFLGFWSAIRWFLSVLESICSFHLPCYMMLVGALLFTLILLITIQMGVKLLLFQFNFSIKLCDFILDLIFIFYWVYSIFIGLQVVL